MAVSDSDIKILQLLARFRFVPVETIRAECFPGQTPATARAYCSRRLKHLREIGLTESQTVLGRAAVHYLTEEGSQFMGVEGGAGVGVRLAEYHHDLAVLGAYLALRDRGDRPGLVTEREARSTCPDAKDNDYAIPITRPSGKQGVAWPDLVSGDVGALIGYEVEWTRKPKRRLILLMHGYGHSPHYRIGVYLTVPDTHERVTEAAADANASLMARGLGRPILVRPLAGITGQQCEGSAS